MVSTGLFLIVLAMLGFYLICSKKAERIGRALVMLCVSAITLFAMFFMIIAATFSTADSGIYAIIYIVLAFVIISFCGCALWGVIKKKQVWIPLMICTVICIVTLVAMSAYQLYTDSIPTVGESDGTDMLWAYAPYAEDSKVVTLHEESTLKIESDFPKMDGATALYPVYSAFAKAVYPKELIGNIGAKDGILYSEYLDCNTTTGAYSRIVSGETDIIFVAAPSEEQQQYAGDCGVELVYTPIGKEAFVFFVNGKNSLDDITVEQIQNIYSAKITEWSQLGVEGFGSIRAFQRDEGSGSQSALISLMDGKELMVPPKEDVIDGMGGIISRTADYKNYKNAIGYSFRFYSTEMVENNQIKLLSVNGIAPTVENIENGTYPIASYFYAVTRKDMTPNTKQLLDWIVSEQGQKLIEMTGYTSLK